MLDQLLVNTPITQDLVSYLGLAPALEQTIQEQQQADTIRAGLSNILNSLQTRQQNQVTYLPTNFNHSTIDYSGLDKKHSTSALNQSIDMIKKHEGFSSSTYWDVNAHRLGYGSDTITNRDGSVRKVRKGDHVTREQAELDLRRRAKEFRDKAARKIGADQFNRLPPEAQASLTSLTYNYGSLNKLGGVVQAAREGDIYKLSNAIMRLGAHNRGINKKRRSEEATYFLK